MEREVERAAWREERRKSGGRGEREEWREMQKGGVEGEAEGRIGERNREGRVEGEERGKSGGREREGETYPIYI